MKNVLLILTLLLSNILTTSATHLMGGEITWECLPNGQFQFTMKVYRDCNSGIISIDVSNGLEVHNYPTVNSPLFSIPLVLISQTDISSTCNASGPALSCDNPDGSSGVVEEFVFKTAPVTLTGTPPAAGWIFSYDGCCRNAGVTNLLNAGNEGFTLRSKMFAYNGDNANPCYDNSPAFAEKPTTAVCAGNFLNYSNNAYDADLDSLSYSWAPALDDFFGAWTNSNPPSLTYTSGYNANSPLPGTVHNPNNLPAVLNPATGSVSYLSYTPGNFVTVVKVEAWKCGTKVAEVYREIQTTILAGCATNTAPAITPLGGIFTAYFTTVTAGELVTFNLTGTDSEFLPNGDPQSVEIIANGSQFGAGFTDANSGCMYPPCATLSPASPVSGITGATTAFSWQTDCNHLGSNADDCINLSNTYTFVFRVRDDFCPLPGENVAVISITVISDDTLVESPAMRCASVLQNGDVELTWSIPDNTVNTFNSYHIYHADSPDGPFTVIDSIFDINTTTYTHIGANADAASQYYYIRTRSACNGTILNVPSATIATIFPVITTAGNGIVNLSWNALSEPLPATSNDFYRIYSMMPGQNWNLVGNTEPTELLYTDTVTFCNDSIYYRVEIADSSGCVSVSAVAGDLIVTENVVADFDVNPMDVGLYNFVNNSDNALHYLWDFGDGNTSAYATPSHLYASSLFDSTITVSLIAWNNCDTDTFVFPLLLTGVNEISSVIDFIIVPNPASTTLTIQSASTTPQSLKILNSIGQVVTLSVVEGQQTTIDISQLPTGLYHLLLEDKQGRVQGRKLVVSR
ncbi:MAG: T9SS type A sorting domain-containing protein [Bacteroidia bacterium]